MHVESQMYLKLSNDFAKEDGSLSLLSLSNHGSKSLHFRLMPLFNFHVEGEPVEYETPV